MGVVVDLRSKDIESVEGVVRLLVHTCNGSGGGRGLGLQRVGRWKVMVADDDEQAPDVLASRGIG